MSKKWTIKPTFSYSILVSFKFILFAMSIIAATYFLMEYFPSYSDYLRYMMWCSALPAFMAFYRMIYWRFVRYEISENQIKYKRGVFSLREDYLEMYRIKDFERNQPFLLRLFNIMNFTLVTSDRSHPILILNGIPASNLAEAMRDLVERSRLKNRVHEID